VISTKTINKLKGIKMKKIIEVTQCTGTKQYYISPTDAIANKAIIFGYTYCTSSLREAKKLAKLLKSEFYTKFKEDIENNKFDDLMENYTFNKIQSKLIYFI